MQTQHWPKIRRLVSDWFRRCNRFCRYVLLLHNFCFKLNETPGTALPACFEDSEVSNRLQTSFINPAFFPMQSELCGDCMELMALINIRSKQRQIVMMHRFSNDQDQFHGNYKGILNYNQHFCIKMNSVISPESNDSLHYRHYPGLWWHTIKCMLHCLT